MGTGESGAAEESDEGVGLGGGVGAGLGGGVGVGAGGVGEGAGAGGVGDVSGGVSVWLGLAMVGVIGGGDKLCSAGRGVYSWKGRGEGVFAELGVLDGVVVRCEKGKMCSANVT